MTTATAMGEPPRYAPSIDSLGVWSPLWSAPNWPHLPPNHDMSPAPAEREYMVDPLPFNATCPHCGKPLSD